MNFMEDLTNIINNDVNEIKNDIITTRKNKDILKIKNIIFIMTQ